MNFLTSIVGSATKYAATEGTKYTAEALITTVSFAARHTFGFVKQSLLEKAKPEEANSSSLAQKVIPLAILGLGLQFCVNRLSASPKVIVAAKKSSSLFSTLVSGATLGAMALTVLYVTNKAIQTEENSSSKPTQAPKEKTTTTSSPVCRQEGNSREYDEACKKKRAFEMKVRKMSAEQVKQARLDGERGTKGV